MPDRPAKLGATIRAERERLGLSQEALAALAGVSRTYLGEVERGAVSVSVATLERISAALKLDISVLLALYERR